METTPSPPTAAQRIDALMEIHPKGFDLSLGRIEKLLKRLGDPQKRIPPVIHVAGTNGKGSTIAFMRAILEAAGLSVHVHTSPHLVNWNERYRLGQQGAPGKLVDDHVLSDAIERVATANQGRAITVFEVLTAVTFVLFNEHPADVCLLEVGLGGRFDATNVLEKTDISVITPVSIDHEAYLGDTLAKIAFEKAGIIKRRTPVVVGHQESEALEVIERQAARNLAPLVVDGQDYSAIRENGRFVFRDDAALLDLMLPRLAGEHQIANAATAIAASRQFCSKQGHELRDFQIEEGLQNAYWPARMQRIVDGALIEDLSDLCDVWLDGGHNPGAAVMIAQFLADLDERDPRPVTMICGMLDTKDTVGYFRQFKTLVERVIAVPVLSSDAGLAPEVLGDRAEQAGLPAATAPSLTKALQMIDRNRPARLLISGSLYLAGDFLDQNRTPPR